MTCGKKKYTCGDSSLRAVCVIYEGDLPEWSSLEECVDLEETTEELYGKVDQLLTEVDLTALSTECENIEIQEDATGKVTVQTFAQTVLTALETLLCAETPTEITSDILLTDYELEYGCLVTSCDEDITKLSELLQALINKSCEEEPTPQVLINAGAVSLLTKITHVSTTTASALTLAAPREGQRKFIVMIADGGNAVIGVPDLVGGTSITMGDVNDFIELLGTNGKWHVIVNSGCVIA